MVPLFHTHHIWRVRCYHPLPTTRNPGAYPDTFVTTTCCSNLSCSSLELEARDSTSNRAACPQRARYLRSLLRISQSGTLLLAAPLISGAPAPANEPETGNTFAAFDTRI
ncbi:hypothetical protein EVAR_59939_1 [Eumeta japonica]|uniref:Uncharacterized protein n=1 Tax=Eumeta variegata TaxID=151549 RepID=A0A4C1ZGY7_EUMVA|nr:hypothetical protein EVAR_59939_1 [Eumeta japonica]